MNALTPAMLAVASTSPAPTPTIDNAGAALVRLWAAHEAAEGGIGVTSTPEQNRLEDAMCFMEGAILDAEPRTLADAAIQLATAASEIANGNGFEDGEEIIDRALAAVRRSARLIADLAAATADDFPWVIYLARHVPRGLISTYAAREQRGLQDQDGEGAA